MTGIGRWFGSQEAATTIGTAGAIIGICGAGWVRYQVHLATRERRTRGIRAGAQFRARQRRRG